MESIGVVAAVVSGRGLAVALYTYSHQREVQGVTDARLDAAEERLQHAHLDLELRREGEGGVMLVVRNLGPHEARGVQVEGSLDRGGYQRMREWPMIAPGGEQALIVPQPGYKIIAGNSHFDTLVTWEDGAGQHDRVPFVATRRIPDKGLTG